jgi:dTDP-4-dehydrorhamnose reductase
MKIVITGGKGLLGRTLQAALAEHELTVADLPAWDVTDGERTMRQILEVRPDVVIHCAAMTNVDACEADRAAAFRLNEEGARNVAVACKVAGARLIALSTDYVFSGDPPREPWAWSETDIPRPRTVYGASKAAGEQLIGMILPDAVILRVAWLYGAGGPSFLHTMVAQGRTEGPALKVVDDQRGNPTSCRVVADVIRFLLTQPSVSGIVHATCEDQCSWYELTVELFRLLGLKRAVEPCTTAEFPRPAPRPRHSALKKSVLNVLGYRTPRWQEALAAFVETEFPEENTDGKRKEML